MQDTANGICAVHPEFSLNRQMVEPAAPLSFFPLRIPGGFCDTTCGLLISYPYFMVQPRLGIGSGI
jgi:hypothetical protein